MKLYVGGGQDGGEELRPVDAVVSATFGSGGGILVTKRQFLRGIIVADEEINEFSSYKDVIQVQICQQGHLVSI